MRRKRALQRAGRPGPLPAIPPMPDSRAGPAPRAQPGGAPAQATEWWWIGPESINGRLAYVDRAALRRMPDGRMEVYLLDIYGTPLANGTTREVGLYLIDCRNRLYERTGALAMDEEGHNLTSSETAPPTGA